MTVRFYINEVGNICNNIPKELKLIASFLNDEVQSMDSAKSVLAYIAQNRFALSRDDMWIGNAFGLTVGSDEALIKWAILEDMPSVRVNVDFLKEIIINWAEFKASKETELIFTTQHNP